jgi:hypothetical protein
MTLSSPSDLIFSGVSKALPQIMTMVWPLFFIALFISAAKVFCRCPQLKGWVGERTVSAFSLKVLNRSVYTLFEDIYLPRPDGKGTTQIDHIVVSTYGIFVIETKNMKGWIFGTEDQERWTQVVRGKKSGFQNPLRQNRLHVKALMACLGLPESVFHSVVYFAGGSTFKTRVPSNVIDRGLKGFIEKHGALLLNSEQVAATVMSLEDLAVESRDGHVRREHVQNLKRLHGGRGKKAA